MANREDLIKFRVHLNFKCNLEDQHLILVEMEFNEN
jgi:hypothetical protein